MKVGDPVIVTSWPGLRELVGKLGKIQKVPGPRKIFFEVLVEGHSRAVLFHEHEIRSFPHPLIQLALQGE